MVILAPGNGDRGTEIHFRNLFKDTNYICPDEWGVNVPTDRELPHADNVLLFEGGTDINSALYGEKQGPWNDAPDLVRDAQEVFYYNKAREVGAPMIGICRGAQLLCALNGGHIIQDAQGHNANGGRHMITLPKCFGDLQISTTSAHHQMMNPYFMDRKDWVSLGYTTYPRAGKQLLGEHGQKLKLKKLYKDFEEQEIIWFPKTKCLCIQGHPEWIQDGNDPFVAYCRLLIRVLILGEKTGYDILAQQSRK